MLQAVEKKVVGFFLIIKRYFAVLLLISYNFDVVMTEFCQSIFL